METVRIKLKEIANFLVSFKSDQDVKNDLFTGSGGIALFLFYYSRYVKDHYYEEIGMEYLSNSIHNINKLRLDYTFCGGISGLCWCIDHLITHHFIDRENKEILDYFDKFLCNRVKLALLHKNNDFLHGAIGASFFLLKRIQKPIVRKTLHDLIGIMDSQKECFNDQYYWNYKIGNKTANNTCNISLSHGMSSSCIFLTKALNLGINKIIAEDLLKKSIAFIINQEIKFSERLSMFPTYSLMGQNNLGQFFNSRLGWCYGDLGIAISIWHYSQLVKNRSLEKKAIEIFKFSSMRRDLRKNAVIDGGICHGTAGIALIFKRIYIYTNIAEFKECSEYWLEQTLKMAKYKDGFAGYIADQYGPSIGLLDGIAGIGLVLLAFITNEEPLWDEFLLLS